MTTPVSPVTVPGEILSWPMLKVSYLTDLANIAALLPPGISPGKNPKVTITIYNFPVLNEPEYGCMVNVEAIYNGIEGEYTLGIGIDQEAAIFGSHERWGQLKFYAETKCFRLVDTISACVTHRGYTFLEYHGKVSGAGEIPPEFETNEWWIKCLRGVDITKADYDFPPHVIRVYSKYGTAFVEKLEGNLRLNDSPWDPVASCLPPGSEPQAHLWTPVFLDRQITLEGPVDEDGFHPFADTIGGSRWPGENGGPISN